MKNNTKNSSYHQKQSKFELKKITKKIRKKKQKLDYLSMSIHQNYQNIFHVINQSLISSPSNHNANQN